ncbi:MAG TPA: DUF4097 family beta strand repeat-containing protein [Actinophytocola sp.]|uniref:DUF4097 family beta strand repeat-containing protein n=1 Tax=Actinophytocola sp. TaxID=1872138 RepID=UPI002DDCB209|nr:DUF4097 family beta strand repeat-containing protein [Actinophytocola sp.]HEV2784196.1 DUF4097 family beta strand repeat-containing protein [Actinophytocola sp.]
MTEEFQARVEDEAEDLVRQQSFEVDGPVELDLRSGAGRIEVRLVDEAGVHVEIRHDPSAASPWMRGVSSLLTWVSDQFGGQFGEQVGEVSPAEAVRQTRIELTGNRVVVRTPLALPLRTVPVAVTVRAPAGSHVTARSGAASISVTGTAGRLDLHSGSGEINAERADGAASVQSGSGAVRLGAMPAGLRARTGTGDVEVSAVGGPTSLHTGSGDVWLGAVSGDVMARTGSGDLTVADATSGQIELQTGSGAIRIGVRKGSPAEVDLSSATGEARSELALSDTRPESEPTLRIRGRTASGIAVVSPAAT